MNNNKKDNDDFESVGSLNVEMDEESQDGDQEYAPVEMSVEDIDFEINELELEIKALREKKQNLLSK